MIRLVAWMDHAACASEHPDWWFAPEGGDPGCRADREQYATAICAGCPVRLACLAYALRRGEQYGVWGGLTPTQLNALRRKRARAA